MKSKTMNNTNGITICDSIVMSVRNKRPNFRRAESVLIAIMGFVSVILAFLGMFEFRYNTPAVVTASVALSAFYIVLVLIGGKALWVLTGSVLVFAFAAYRSLDKLTEGFKYAYNIIYSASFHTDIKYYKHVDPSLEDECLTTLFIFGIWLLAIVIYYFTISRPNPILPLMATFPLIEIGLYNGIEIPIFWGILTVAYWLSLLAMSTIDVGEYSGGHGGFVRKDDLFFPKRQMKLKVTEKCGILVIAAVVIIAMLTSLIMNLSGYERSEELNRKRRDISEALSAFTLENLAESISRLTSAFGFSFSYENNKLGTNDHISYKNETDMLVTFDTPIDGAVYLKDYNGCVYEDNEWKDLSESAYNDKMFYDFKYYGIHTQDFPCLFTKLNAPSTMDMTMWIELDMKKPHTFAPYGVDNYGDLTYDDDLMVGSDNGTDEEFSYKFVHIDAENAAQYIDERHDEEFKAAEMQDSSWKDSVKEYCENNDLYTFTDNFNVSSRYYADKNFLYHNPHLILAELLESRYSEFVYDHYLQLPDDNDMDEIREHYSDILDNAGSAVTIQEKMEILQSIRKRMSDETTYTLSPGKTPSNRDFVNYFLLENQKGYCTHYASAGVILARMAGIPARYTTGYIIVGDDFDDAEINPDGTLTIDVRDNRSHAWIEVYLDGFGWVPFECTAGYTRRSVNPGQKEPAEPTEPDPDSTTTTAATTVTVPVEVSTQTTQLTVTSYVNATTTVTTAGNGNGTGMVGRSSSDDDDDSFEIPGFVKTIAVTLMLALIAAGIVWLRRYMIVSRRNRLMTTGSNFSRIGYMYQYAEKLLAYLKLNKEDMKYTEFAEKVENHLGGTHFERGSFDVLVNTALQAGFGNKQPTEDELAACQSTVSALAGSIYSRAGAIQKLYLKLINILV